MERSRIIKVEFELVLPCDATKEQVLEWVASELHHAGGCSDDNPLLDHDVEALSEPTLSDTMMHLHEHVECAEKVENTTYFRRSRSRRPEPYHGASADEQIRTLLGIG